MRGVRPHCLAGGFANLFGGGHDSSRDTIAHPNSEHPRPRQRSRLNSESIRCLVFRQAIHHNGSTNQVCARGTPCHSHSRPSGSNVRGARSCTEYSDYRLAYAHRLPKDGETNVLITSALPYCNNVPHLGELITDGCRDRSF